MSELTERARKLLERITPGPWVRDGRLVTAEAGPVVMVGVRMSNDTPPEADAEFIAASPSLIRDLIEEVERLERDRDQG